MKQHLIPLTVAALLMVIGPAAAQQPYTTPDDAVNALVAALKSDDAKAVIAVLGPDGEDILSSGDTVADAKTRSDFLAAYDARHRIETKGNKAELIVGLDDFPVPLPLTRKNDAWRFDTAAGRREILLRRIGRNELSTIKSCLAYVDAQNEYADKNPSGSGANIYAQRIVSSPGAKDGLFWPTKDGEEASPLGELVAQAVQRGYRVGAERAPYNGYYFKILTRQGPAAPGGALDYVFHGKMIGGFALVAYPAEYRNSGVMTFIVSHAGVVYQKDLGRRTTSIAERMTAFNPDRTWTRVDETAASQK